MGDTWDPFDLLDRARVPDGGFGIRPGSPSEPEPTALAALALGDADARAWLAAHQRPDGSVGLVGGPFADEAVTPLAALALRPGRAREAALNHIEASRGRTVPDSEAIPLDESITGWSWNRSTASWVEPTGRALWALRELRPGSDAIPDAVALLRDRESVGGGWNYGNREVLGEELPPFAQTTAAAMMGLRGIEPELEARGLTVLRRIWRTDAPGPLTLAMCAAAFSLHGERAASGEVRDELHRQLSSTSLEPDSVTVAWIILSDRGGGDAA